MKRLVLLALVGLFSITSALADDWMARLSNSTPIWKVSIPGTHDAATSHGFSGFLGTLVGSSMAQTQDKTLAEQWRCGVRCFDLRPAVNGSSLDIFHGILQTKLSMQKAMELLCDSLDAHPTEFCVVLMRHESDGDDNNSKWSGMMRDLLKTDKIYSHLIDFKGTMTVRQARGKMLLISRDTYDEGPFGAYTDGWTHEADINQQTAAGLVNSKGERTSLYEQDFYDSTNGKLDTKVNAVVELLKKMVAMRKRTSPVTWCINYCSAYSKTTNILSYKISSADGYRDNAEKVHAAVLDYMATQPLGGPMGIMIMDFAGVDKSGGYKTRGKELVDMIIKSNFAEEDLKIETRDALQKLYDEAMLLNPSLLTDVVVSQLDAALAQAETVLGKSAPTLTELQKAFDALSSIYESARTMDKSVLQGLYEEMIQWGYDDPIAADALAKAFSQEELNQANEGIVTRYKWHVATKSEQPTKWATPSQSVVGIDDNVPATYVDDIAKGYYLYNVGTGRWFCGGDDWGAHAAVGFPGVKVTTPKDDFENGHYNGIVTWLCNGNWGDLSKLNADGYCDTPGNAWKFWLKDAAKGIYTISNNGSNQGNNESNGCGTKDLVGFNPSTLARVDVHQSGADDPNNQWVFVTEAQRDAMAYAQWKNASPSNPVDLTYKIQMPGFNQRERLWGENQQGERLPWTCNHENYTYDNTPYNYDDLDHASRHIICERGRNHSDFCVDIYDWPVFSLSQTITGLRAGVYRVKVQGYYDAPERYAYLEANGKRTQLMYQRDQAMPSWVNGGQYADNTWQSIECFQNGMYWNEVICTVRSDGRLDIAVRKDDYVQWDVLIFDNFRLEYIGHDPADAIQSVSADTDATPVYNLAGQRLSRPSRGVNVIGGKKVAN